jgi:hypothetical protein
MGKRSSFERRANDYYPTPKEAVLPLLPHLPPNSTFVEPCAGDGRLVRHLEEEGHKCHYSCDIEPHDVRIFKRDALEIPHVAADFVITNPPFTRPILHSLIDHFAPMAPTFFLIDANWMFTKQAGPYLERCKKIITIGRVKWIEGTNQAGKDDSCWYLFGNEPCVTEFYPRIRVPAKR